MPCACGHTASFKRQRGKDLISCVGDVRVDRRTYRCKSCGASTPAKVKTPFDVWAGLQSDHLTPRTRRLAALAGSTWSFDEASVKLKELCGVRLSDQTIRRACDKAGAAARQWLEDSPAAIEPVRQAKGEAEMYTDGTMVNTREGWREIRLTALAKREPAAPAEPPQWDQRVLPAPTARLAQASLAPADAVGRAMAKTASRAGLEQGLNMSVLADGAKWIWNQCGQRLPRAEQSLDVFHLSQHLHDAGKAIHGEGSEPARRFAEDHLLGLLRDGAGHLSRRLLPMIQQARAAGAACQSAALRDLIAYLWPNRHRLDYASRLRRGLPIGSGLVEGGCKTIIGRRLKLNSARWNPQRAENMAALRCVDYSDRWSAFWASEAA